MAGERDETVRRRFVQALGMGVGFGMTSPALATATDRRESTDEEAKRADDHAGLETLESDADFSETLARVEDEIDRRELALVTTIDHADNAAAVDRSLQPTSLLLFGNPDVGTPLIQAGRSIGIDLPQKLLVWEDDDVYVTYNDPRFLARRHDLDEVDDRIEGVAETLAAIADAATGSTRIE